MANPPAAVESPAFSPAPNLLAGNKFKRSFELLYPNFSSMQAAHGQKKEIRRKKLAAKSCHLPRVRKTSSIAPRIPGGITDTAAQRHGHSSPTRPHSFNASLPFRTGTSPQASRTMLPSVRCDGCAVIPVTKLFHFAAQRSKMEQWELFQCDTVRSSASREKVFGTVSGSVHGNCRCICLYTAY
jgi:hypothetical protein